MDVINLPCFVLLSVLAQGDEVYMMGVIWLIVSVSCKSCRADLQKVGDFEVSLYHHHTHCRFSFTSCMLINSVFI